jgi:hypothetical protein
MDCSFTNFQKLSVTYNFCQNVRTNYKILPVYIFLLLEISLFVKSRPIIDVCWDATRGTCRKVVRSNPRLGIAKMIQDPSNPTWPMWRGGASFRTRRAGALPDLPPCSFHCKPASGTLRNLSTIEGLFPSHRRLTVFRWRLAGCMLALHGNGNGVWDWDMDERTFSPFPFLTKQAFTPLYK